MNTEIPDIPRLTEADIRTWVGDTSFARGVPYARDGSVFDTRRYGQTLKGRCQGTLPSPYQVSVDFGAAGITASYCSCPVGTGRCKHVAALLLTYLAHPKVFEETEAPDTLLQEYSHAELLALVKRMLERYPDLEKFLERHPPQASAAHRSVTPDAIRRQVETAFRSIGDEWGGGYHLPADLLDLVEQGDEYAAAGKWADAITVYETVARETLAGYGEVHDDEGEILEPVGECVLGLGKGLETVNQPSERERILRALFDVYAWDVDYGGVGVSDEIPDMILDNALPDERRRVAGWVREGLRGTQSAVSKEWARRQYGMFLLALEAEWLDDEGYLHICRETGLEHGLVDRLLSLNRLDEAMSAARPANDYSLLNLADLFVAHDQADVAEQLVRERATTSQDTRLLAWLQGRTAARGDVDSALVIALDLFWRFPQLAHYQAVRNLAQRVGRWEDVRADLMTRLIEKGQAELLTDIHLDEGEIDQALVTVKAIRDYWGRPGAGSRHVQVAEAAEDTRPEAAIGLYLRVVESLVAERNRPAYALAATYLVRVRDLYRRLGEDAIWRNLITRLRQDYRQLRALQDEWNNAKL